MNDIDRRDERLGEELDRAVRDLRPEAAPDRVVPAGTRRRVVRVVASVSLVIVFVSAVGWMATQVRRSGTSTAASGSSDEPTVPTMYRDDVYGFTVSVPTDWEVSSDRINTWVTDPREILAMATYPLRPGGHAVTDGQVPSNAVDDLGPNDMFIWVSQRWGADSSYPMRPTSFSPQTVCDGDHVCEAGHGQGLEGIRGWWFYFRDAGRGIYVFVGMGESAHADPVRSEDPWHVLDSLTFDDRSGLWAACPALDDVTAPDDSTGAEAVASNFVHAVQGNDHATIDAALDPAGTANDVVRAANVATASFSVSTSLPASDDPLVLGGCGPATAAVTRTVVIDDGTDSASADFNLYLIHRSDGWKVWGAY